MSCSYTVTKTRKERQGPEGWKVIRHAEDSTLDAEGPEPIVHTATRLMATYEDEAAAEGVAGLMNLFAYREIP